MSGGYYKFVKTTDSIIRAGQWRFDTILGERIVTNEKGTVIPLSNVIAIGDVLPDVRGLG